MAYTLLGRFAGGSELISKIVARTQKVKTGNVIGIGNHNQRKFENHSNEDIDPEKKHLKYDLVQGRTESFKTDIEKFIEENKSTKRATRKDAVLVNEWLISSDQEFFKSLSADKTRDFFETAKDYFAEKIGDQNIRYAIVHLDETTPHLRGDTSSSLDLSLLYCCIWLVENSF